MGELRMLVIVTGKFILVQLENIKKI